MFLLRSQIPCRVCFYSMAPNSGYFPRGGTRAQNLEHLYNMIDTMINFLYLTSAKSFQKAFILRPYDTLQWQCSDNRVHFSFFFFFFFGGGGGAVRVARGKNLELL